MLQKNHPERFNRGILLENCQQRKIQRKDERLSDKEIGEKTEKNLVKQDRIAEALIPTVKPLKELFSGSKFNIMNI